MQTMQGRDKLEAEKDSKLTPQRIWDLPIRLCHWLMAFCFIGAYITSESDKFRLIHTSLGYTLGLLICFRLVWGLTGTHYSRFSSFIFSPRQLLIYLRSLLQGMPIHYSGHNPAGAIAIFLMLLIGSALVASGWLMYTDRIPEWGEELHETLANIMLFIVLIHIVGVIVASYFHRENLANAMLTGFKLTNQDERSVKPMISIAILLLLIVFSFWLWQAKNIEVTTNISEVISNQDVDDD